MFLTEIGECEGNSDAHSFLQSAYWGEFKGRFGWKPRFFQMRYAYSDDQQLLVLLHELHGGFSLAYIPWGPTLADGLDCDAKNAALLETARALRKLLPRRTLLVRFDPPWFVEEPQALPAHFVRAAANVQPPDTVLVDLAPDAEAILGRMKPKTRYNIRLAEKKITIRKPDAAGCREFYALLQETARRDGIAIHQAAYYSGLFDCVPEGKLHLYLAEHEGDVIAGVVVLWHGTTATYLYGASSNTKRNLMAPYLLQWRAMLDAKNAGCTVYDLFGIPPDDDPRHPMAGLYRFKTGFGGAIEHRPGSLDFPCHRLAYRCFRFAEKARKILRDLKKRGRYTT